MVLGIFLHPSDVGVSTDFGAQQVGFLVHPHRFLFAAKRFQVVSQLNQQRDVIKYVRRTGEALFGF